MNEEEKILEELESLKEEHRSLDDKIANGSGLDLLQLQRLKKRKLWLKDQIARLHSVLHPDIIA